MIRRNPDDPATRNQIQHLIDLVEERESFVDSLPDNLTIAQASDLIVKGRAAPRLPRIPWWHRSEVERGTGALDLAP